MQLTQKTIFWKCWKWSVTGGIVIAALFWLVTSIVDIFHWDYGGTVFLDMLVGSSMIGGYFGAGLIGWRIADKYYHDAVAQFIKDYKQYSIISFILFVAVIYSPLSILAFLWSVLAPACVLMALSKAKKDLSIPEQEPNVRNSVVVGRSPRLQHR